MNCKICISRDFTTATASIYEAISCCIVRYNSAGVPQWSHMSHCNTHGLYINDRVTHLSSRNIGDNWIKLHWYDAGKQKDYESYKNDRTCFESICQIISWRIFRYVKFSPNRLTPSGHQWPLLQTWFNFNPSMNKLSYAQKKCGAKLLTHS